MRSVNLTEAKARLGRLVEQAASGETIQIARRGKPVARLVAVDRPLAVERPRKPVDVAALKALTDSMPHQRESGGRFMRRLRDRARY